jgi:conjugative relaxase-like TrwC/TraI family protein
MAYYTDAAGEPPGQWAGKGAERLGLSGAVDPGVIYRLFHKDITPDGERLTGKRRKRDDGVDAAVAAWRQHHPYASATEIAEYRSSQLARNTASRAYFDHALGLDKSVSVLHSSLAVSARKAREAGDQETAGRLQAEADAIENAVLETARILVREIEKDAAYTRTGHHSGRSAEHGNTGEWRDAYGVTSAIFVQHTSHEGDPHLHAHVTVHNRVQRADGADLKYRTLDSRSLYAQRLRLAAITDREMETRMSALGWPMVKRADGNGAEVAGVDDQIIEMFSSRRVAMRPEVEALAAEYKAKHGHPPGQRALWLMKQHVSMRQRKASPKNHASPANLLAEWERQTTEREVQALSTVHEAVRATSHGATAVLDQAAKERAARIAVAEVQKHHAVWSMSQLMFEVGRALPVLPATADAKAVLTEIARLATSGRCGADVALATAPDITDVSALGVRESDGGSIFRPPHEERWTTVDHLDMEETVLRDAKRAVPQLVTVERARAAVAGTDLNEEQRAAVVTMLTSRTGTTALIAPAGAGKTHAVATFARLWTELTGGRVIGLTTSTNAARVMASEGLAESYNIAEFLGKVKDSDQLRRPVPVHERDVLVLDEATQVGTADWALVQHAARAAGARTAGVGDTFQLGAVGAGGMFRLVAQEVPSAELREVLRFRDEWERDASVRLREGDFTVYADYDRRGRMQGADHEKAFDRAVSSWLADHLAGKTSLLLAGSNQEAAELSRRAQDRLVKLGRVQEPRAALPDGNTAGEGDLIRARLNSSIDAGGRLLTNRDTLKVTGWNGKDAVVQRRELDGSWTEKFILPGSYMAENCELDYAGNTHVGQGRTVDTGHLLVSETLDRAGLYVGMTRGRDGNHAHIVTGDTAPEGRKPYEQATPESVVRAVMRRDEADLSATEQIRQSQEWASGTGHVLNLWTEAVRPAVTPDIDARFRDCLSEDEYGRYQREHARPVLVRALQERQLRGQDVGQLISQITATPMDRARSVSAVLHGRLMQVAEPDDEVTVWAQRTPQNAPRMAHELAQGLDARLAELGDRAVREPQPWLLDRLGVLAPGASPLLREDYARRAGIAAGYREAAGITDPRQAISLHPHHGNPGLEAMRLAAIRALEITVEQVHEMSRGQLEARVAEGERVMASAPPDVSAKLKVAALAEADALRRAADTEVAGDREAAGNARDLAALLNAEKASLEPGAARYEGWSGATARVREQAGEAKAELDRRGYPEPEEDGAALSQFGPDLAAVDAAAEAAFSRQEQAASEPAEAAEDPRAVLARDALERAKVAAGRLSAERDEAAGLDDYAARMEREAQVQEPAVQAEEEAE